MKIRLLSAASVASPSTEGFELGWEKTLPFAARPLHISADIKDYFLQAVPIIISDLPNRNGVAFPLHELLAWNTARGCQAYRSWVGMPMHVEHKSEDPTKAIGLVVDVAMRPIRGTPYWKVIALAAIDRTKNPTLAGKMERGELNTYSMGCLVDSCTCSFCGAEVGECNHISSEEGSVTFYELGGRLVFKNVHGVNAIELSVVEDPAYGIAIGGGHKVYG